MERGSDIEGPQKNSENHSQGSARAAEDMETPPVQDGSHALLPENSSETPRGTPDV